MQAILKAVFLGFCFLLVACLPSKDKQLSADTAKIVKGEIGGQTYYVPEVYFSLQSDTVSSDSLYVHAMYPEFAPILDNPNDLWKKGEWYKNISILADHNSGRKFAQASEASEVVARSATEFGNTVHVVGEEYGLIHQTQPPGGVQDIGDVWIEKRNGRILSHITCGEKLSENSVPQCAHWTNWNNFFLTIRYNKRLLPEWKRIEQDSLALLDSFKSEQTARDYLGQKLIEIKKKKEGIQQ